MWWQYALWGLAGAAVNRTVIYLDAAERVKGKGPAWRAPHGPGGGMYLLAVALHCGVGAVVTGALFQSGWVTKPVFALGLGAAAPLVVKKLSAYTLALLPRTGEDSDQDGTHEE